MIIYLSDSLMIEAAYCIVGVGTKSAIATGGRISSIIEFIMIPFCLSDIYQRADFTGYKER